MRVYGQLTGGEQFDVECDHVQLELRGCSYQTCSTCVVLNLNGQAVAWYVVDATHQSKHHCGAQ